MNFKTWLISENQENLIKLYHGGSLWESGGPTVFPSKKGKHEHGIGIYLTTKYETARKYAKGGKVVLAVYVDPNFVKIDQVKLPAADIISFVKSVPKMKNKNEIENYILNYESRTNGPVPLSVLNNLVVNFEAGSGYAGLLVNKFLVQNGVDVEITKFSGEDWLIVFDTSIIKKWEKVNPSTLNIKDYELPRID